jgi:hypothetical protein
MPPVNDLLASFAFLSGEFDALPLPHFEEMALTLKEFSGNYESVSRSAGSKGAGELHGSSRDG